MENQEKQTNVLGGGVKSNVITEKDWYRKKNIEMIGKIENERFLKAIYISVSDYLKENEPD